MRKLNRVFKLALTSTSSIVRNTFHNIGQVLTIRIGAFSSVAAYLTWHILSPAIFPKVPEVSDEGNIAYLRSDFNESSMADLEGFLEHVNHYVGNDERALLVIHSPGGSVFDGTHMIERMTNSKVPVDIYVPAFAASMGADTLMRGQQRFADPGALILFHGSSAGSRDTTEPALKNKLRILESPEFLKTMRDGEPSSNLPFDLQAKHISLLAEVTASDYSTVLSDTASLYDIISTINKGMVEAHARILGWTVDKVREVLFGNMERDMVFTGQELFDMGVITGLGRPDLHLYKEM